MLATIEALRSNGHLNMGDALHAIEAHQQYSPWHTIGWELEVASTAKADVPNAVSLSDSAGEGTKCDIRELGFDVSDEPGYLYEIQSRPAAHSLTLSLATKGLVRAGWLPKKTSGIVTAHLNIGTSVHDELLEKSYLSRLINLLRSIEAAGHTSPDRLLEPSRFAKVHNCTDVQALNSVWACKGIGGIRIMAAEFLETWVGDNNRIELRTAQYFDSEQFSQALEMSYYLTKGLLAPTNSVPYQIYAEYEAWWLDYLQSNKLPLPANILSYTCTMQDFDGYITPYAEHLYSGEKRATVARHALAATQRLREAFAE